MGQVQLKWLMPQDNESKAKADAEIRKGIQRASLLMMASVILSRVFGFFRDMVLARTMGATAFTDVYYASFTIPEFLNYLLAAGALSISFIPMLSGYLNEGKQEFGKKVFRSLSTVFGGLLLVFIIFAEIFAPSLGHLIAPGFSVEQHVILTSLLRIILPAQLFFFWGGLAVAVQQTHGRFFLPATAPLIYNLGIIVCGLAFHRSLGIAGFSIGVLVGAVVSQGVIQWFGIRALGYSALPYFEWTAPMKQAFKRYLWLSLPIMLGFSLVVTDDWFSKYFASSLEKGSVSWLSYARTEMRIPIAIIGQAAGIASFPYLSRLWANRAYHDYTKTLIREIEKLWVLAPLATILLINHALPITHFIYGGGRLTELDLQHTAKALQIFGIGIFFWTAQVLLARGFYACQMTWIPSLIGTIMSVVTIPLYSYLAKIMSYRGLALAGSLGITAYTLILWFLLRLHLKKYAPQFSLVPFYQFCASWAGLMVALGLVSEAVYRLGIYRSTQLSGLLDVLVVLTLTVPTAYLAQRTFFRRFTGEALY